MDSTNPLQTVESWLRLLAGGDEQLPNPVIEIRGLECSTLGMKRLSTYSGYFDRDHFAEAAAAILTLSKPLSRGGHEARGVYFTLNPCLPAILSRRANRIASCESREPTTADAEIARRRLLLIDCDPRRPASISSSAEEHNESERIARGIADRLAADGWPAPAIADSGNGWHLLYRIDLPPDDGGIVRRCLAALSAEHSTPQSPIAIDVDTSVFNPARICKAYGSMARKGDSTPDRPHRRSMIVEHPESLTAVPLELLRLLAAKAPAEKQPRSPRHPSRSPPTVGDRVRKYLAACRPSIAGQHGHDNAYRVACELIRGFNLAVDDALPFFAEWNQRCEPPWSDRELLRKLEEAATNAEGEPGYLLTGGGHQSPGDANQERIDVASSVFDTTGFGDEPFPATANRQKPPTVGSKAPPIIHIAGSATKWRGHTRKANQE